MVHTRNGEGVVFAKHFVGALLSVCSQVLEGQVVKGQTLVSCDSGAFENRHRETWTSTHVTFVGRETRRRVDRIIVREHDMR